MKAVWRNRVDVVAIGGPIADALDDLVSANNTQPIELSLPNNTTTKIHAGKGSPEGVLAGSPGDLWLRTDGGTVTTLYLKTSGLNSKTGWTTAQQSGVWIPSLGGTTTYTAQTGTWTKTGLLVQVQGHLTVNVIGTGSTGVITGVPFAAATLTSGSVGYFATAAGNFVFVSCYITGSSVVITGLAAAANTVAVPAVFFGNGTDAYFNVVYTATS